VKNSKRFFKWSWNAWVGIRPSKKCSFFTKNVYEICINTISQEVVVRKHQQPTQLSRFQFSIHSFGREKKMENVKKILLPPESLFAAVNTCFCFLSTVRKKNRKRFSLFKFFNKFLSKVCIGIKYSMLFLSFSHFWGHFQTILKQHMTAYLQTLHL
jgi:hypothetical protein